MEWTVITNPERKDMAEHAIPEAIELDTLDWMSAKLYLDRNPKGAFYALTEMKKVVKLTQFKGTGYYLAVEGFGNNIRDSYHLTSVTSKGRPDTTLGDLRSFGLVQLIVFVGREAESLEDLASIAGPRYNELLEHGRARFEALDEPTSEMMDASGTEYYIMVQKPRSTAVYPSMFYAMSLSSGKLLITLVRQDANVSRGMPFRSPDTFAYKPGDPFMVVPDTLKPKERSLGQIMSIIRMNERMTREQVYVALSNARSAYP